MNKFSIMTKSFILTMSMVGIVYADNTSLQPSLLTSWTGFYAGANAGVVFNNAQLRSQQLGFTNPSETCNVSSNFSTFAPGAQIGYLYQFHNNIVSGIEANIAVNNHQKEILSCQCPDNPDVADSFTFRNQMQISLKGRVGHTVNWNKYFLLPYLTAGASIANLTLAYSNEGGDYYSQNTTAPGWLIGAGIEWGFSQHWSLRTEYSYVNYENAINLRLPSVYGLMDPDGKAQVNLRTNNISASINYWI